MQNTNIINIAYKFEPVNERSPKPDKVIHCIPTQSHPFDAPVSGSVWSLSSFSHPALSLPSVSASNLHESLLMGWQMTANIFSLSAFAKHVCRSIHSTTLQQMLMNVCHGVWDRYKWPRTTNELQSIIVLPFLDHTSRPSQRYSAVERFILPTS